MSVTISDPETEKPVVKAGLAPAYVATWGVIGFASALYVGIVNGAPEVIGLPTHKQVIEEIARTGPAPAAPDDDVRLSAARLEIARLKTELSLREEQARAETRRLPGPPPGDAPRVAVEAEAPMPAGASSFPPSVTAEQTSDLQKERRIAEATIINAPQPPATVETGSIAPAETPTVAAVAMAPPPPERAPERPKVPAAATGPAPVKVAVAPVQGPVVAFGAPVVKPAKVAAPPAASAPATLGISLARAQSVEQLRSTWNLLRSRNGEAFAGLTPRYQMTGSDSQFGPTYSLIAGPLKTADDVARACSAALASGLTCATVSYAGNAL